MSIMAYWPVIAMGVSLTTAGMGGYIDLLLSDRDLTKGIEASSSRIDAVREVLVDRITRVSAELDDQSDSIDTNEEAIEEIQRLLIQRQGQTDLKVQQLQNSIQQQDIKLDQLLNILQDLRQ